MPLTQGQVLKNRYRIVKQIGAGGFGAVYRAWDTAINSPCAIKENLNTTPAAQRQFENEAILLAGLRHANLPRVTDHFQLSGQGQYLVMDFIDGQNLEDMLAQLGRPFTDSEIWSWFTQVCDALTYLHNRTPPIIHRDIKPENIIITPDGQAILVDFGISKVYDSSIRTTKGAKAVTPGYSPPEQYGTQMTDARTDIYALGATLYQLLTGQLPPQGIDLMVGHDTLPPPRQLNPQIRLGTQQAILKAMDLNMEKRFQSVAEFLSALPEPPAPPIHPPPEKRNWRWIGGGLLMISVILLGMFVFFSSGADCSLSSIQLTVQWADSGEAISLTDNRVQLAKSEVLVIRAQDGEQNSPKELNCTWKVSQNGQIIRENGCELTFNPGTTNSPDTIQVTANQASCTGNYKQTLFIETP